MVNRRLLLGAVLPLAMACETDPPARDGTCVVNSALDCSYTVNGDAVTAGWNLVGYSCSGTVRPDDSPTIDHGIPNGLLCANRGAGDGGTTNYCCTPETVECALNPETACAEPEVGYQCRAPNRPEMLNPLILCHQGVFDPGELLNYCCATPETIARERCYEDKGAGCTNGAYRWSCPVGSRPTEEEYTNSESKADFYYLFCSVPMPAPNPAQILYCCFSQALPQVGGTCLQSQSVPGCAPGRYCVACYGWDTAEEDFPPLRCDPGFSGLSAEGYPATLYCCDFREAGE